MQIGNQMKTIIETIRIGLVDQHRLEQDGMKALLGREPQIEIAFTASNESQCLERMIHYGADLLLIDFDLTLEAGLQMVSEIRKKYPRLPLLILSGINPPSLIPMLMKIGVNGYLLKDCDSETLLYAIQQVHSGGLYYKDREMPLHVSQNSPDLSTEKRTARPATLTSREHDVLKLILDEYTTQEIADFLQLSPHTVETHRKNLLVKTGSRNTAGLVRYAIQNKLSDYPIQGRG